MQPCLAWAGCCALALKDDVGQINELPGGLYKREVGKWHIVLNGKGEDNNHESLTLKPFSALVEFNGWPAGIIDPSGGIIAAGDVANESAFIAAIEAELGCSIEDALGLT